jgi:hypothetical protein
MHRIPTYERQELDQKNGIILKMEGNGNKSHSLYHFVIEQSQINSQNNNTVLTFGLHL